MQRADPEGIVLVCDFCRRDWDGQEPMIEGHHGSILCLECCKAALKEQTTEAVAEGHAGSSGAGRFKCTLCLRFNMPASLPHWSNPAHPEAIVCQECLYQAARGFSRTKEIPWTFEPGEYPPAVKGPKAAKETVDAEEPAEDEH